MASFTFGKIKKNIVEAATQNCSLKLENWKIHLLKKSIFLTDIVPHLHLNTL